MNTNVPPAISQHVVDATQALRSSDAATAARAAPLLAAAFAAAPALREAFADEHAAAASRLAAWRASQKDDADAEWAAVAGAR